MMKLRYNELELEVLRVRRWDRKNVTDAAGNYLFARHTLELELVYYPSGNNSFTLLGENPLQEVGHRPVVTDESLRHFLLQPRKELDLTIDGEIVLHTGVAGDLTVGPQPLDCKVVSLAGMRTWCIHYTIQVDVMDREQFGGKTGSPIISHTVEVEEQIDEQLFVTRTFVGTVVFRRDHLITNNEKPDDYRGYFVPQFPTRGFRRLDLAIKATPDGHTIHYRDVWRQVAHGWAEASQITKLDFRWAIDENIIGMAEWGLEAVRAAAHFAKEGLKAASAPLEGAGSLTGVGGATPGAGGVTSGAGGVMAGLGGIMSAARNMIPIATDLLIKALPTTVVTGECVVRGHPRADMTTLITTAGKVFNGLEEWIQRNISKTYSLTSHLEVSETEKVAVLQRRYTAPMSFVPSSEAFFITNANFIVNAESVSSGLFKKGNFPEGPRQFSGPLAYYQGDLGPQLTGLRGVGNARGEGLSAGTVAIVAGVLSEAGLVPPAHDRVPAARHRNPS